MGGDLRMASTARQAALEELEPRWLSTLRVEAAENDFQNGLCSKTLNRTVRVQQHCTVSVCSPPVSVRMFLLNACSKTKRLKRSIARLLLPTRYLR